MVQKGKTTSDAGNEHELKGTFISVLVIGVFILLFWIVMFYVYFGR
jgi:hypothetical protein